MTPEKSPIWPKKLKLFGVNISPVTYEEATSLITMAAQNLLKSVVCHLNTHAVVSAAFDSDLRSKIASFQLATPDGQPVRWSLNRLYGAGLNDRVAGPDLMLRLCSRAQENNLSIYLYGSSESVIMNLRKNLLMRFPTLRIVGYDSPPFRKLDSREDRDTVDRINRSGANLLFLGLGFPKQEIFAFEHKETIHAVQICVGAAFDFLSGKKKRAPLWMQKAGLEWFYRFITEPQRLWKRYFTTNSLFLLLFFKQWLCGK